MRSVPPKTSVDTSIVETDRLDREAFAVERVQCKELTASIDSGNKLLPGFESLAQDIFAIFYKYNVVIQPVESASKWSAFHRRIIDWVVTTPNLALAPNSGVMRSPILPCSPRPASIAIGGVIRSYDPGGTWDLAGYPRSWIKASSLAPIIRSRE